MGFFASTVKLSWLIRRSYETFEFILLYLYKNRPTNDGRFAFFAFMIENSRIIFYSIVNFMRNVCETKSPATTQSSCANPKTRFPDWPHHPCLGLPYIRKITNCASQKWLPQGFSFSFHISARIRNKRACYDGRESKMIYFAYMVEIFPNLYYNKSIPRF